MDSSSYTTINIVVEIAQDEPQAVYCSFTKAISRRWAHVQRTIPDIANLFEPLENAISDKLIPALLGRPVSPIERDILSLPVRLGGMGIQNPTLTADDEFKASQHITHDLTEIICQQEKDLSNYDRERVDDIMKYIKSLKDAKQHDLLQEITDNVDERIRQILELAQEKGAGL